MAIPCSGGYLSNNLHSTFLRDAMPLDHWFHAFQVTFSEMIIAGPDVVTKALSESAATSTTHDYPTALTLYAECRVRPLNHGGGFDPLAAAA